jgi:enoyl-CoA hydratase/carnithine racemase
MPLRHMRDPMPPANVLVEIDGPVARIRLDRPDRLNALTLDMLASLVRAVRSVHRAMRGW